MASKHHPRPSPAKYIPAGCLVVAASDGDLVPQQVWSLPKFPECHHFGNPCIDRDDPLPAGVETALLSSAFLSPYALLLRREWICMALIVGLDKPAQAIIRVFVLPDDVDNRTIPRSDEALRSARFNLMSQLDLSSTTWNWNGEARINPGPASTSSPSENDPSLLELFNNIPSPDPTIQTILDPDYNDAISSILDSKVPGLNTDLIPYQRRSVAVMLQREAETRMVLDPRLVEHLDHQVVPESWFYDPLVGTVLREPRYYDSPRGGILAEEMGTGKTLICLALCLATKHIPGRIPEEHLTDERSVVSRHRPGVSSLADMAAACISRNGVSWKQTFESDFAGGLYYGHCVEAIRRNPASYSIRRAPSRPGTSRWTRSSTSQSADRTRPPKIYLSYASLVIVPPNLISQWKQEMAKHTSGLKVLVCAQTPFTIPPAQQLLDHDILLFSSTAFEKLKERRRHPSDGSVLLDSPLSELHFKRVIVDEGHKLGSSTCNYKLNLQFILDSLHFTSRWIVTGTPSKGLFGIDVGPTSSDASNEDDLKTSYLSQGNRHSVQSWPELEMEDLQRIGSIATYYLAVQPWANKYTEAGGDTPALWKHYVMQPTGKHQKGKETQSRPEILKATLDSLIIRHPLSEIKDLLPAVNKKVVYLDPCYQDTLVLNIFSAMIIFNSVQSQRTDQDYFFHPRQRKFLVQLVSNLRQASFFGGSFFSPPDIRKAVETAETFLEAGRVEISAEDDGLLREAISFARLAAENSLKEWAYIFHEVPVYVKNFPLGAGPYWAIDQSDSEPVCMNTCVIAPLQTFVQECHMNDGRAPGSSLCDLPTALALEGAKARWLELQKKDPSAPRIEDETRSHKSHVSRPVNRRAVATCIMAEDDGMDDIMQPVLDVPLPPFAQTQMVSTASAKLSYLIDQIVRHHHEEQILVFYDSDNVAHCLAEMLGILHIEHLIYSKDISVARRARYVAVFNRSSKFRVLLMDISQAAFGLDMQSASRVYFINPVLDPQVEKQAVGRTKRIGQIRTVTVETLVLRGSLEELIIKRRAEMTPLEQRKCHGIIDDKPIYEWIRNAKILPLPSGPPSDPDQMAKLSVPQLLFGRRLGRESFQVDRDFEAFTEEELANDDGGPTPFQEARVATLQKHLGSAPPQPLASYDSEGDSLEEPAPKRVRFEGV